MRTALFILLILLLLLGEIYSFKAIQFLTKGKKYALLAKVLYWLWTAFVVGLVAYGFFNRSQFSHPKFMSFGFFIASMFIINASFKLLLGGFHFVNEMAATAISQLQSNSTKAELMSRGRFLSMSGLALASVPFASLLYGVVRGRYQFQVIKQTIALNNLPDNFVGKTIVHLSDMHLGSFPQHTKAVEQAITTINELQADYIFFTGDMINERAIEAEPWIDTVAKLKAKHGMFSVLGNHDYGDYYGPWQNQPNKIKENVEHLQEIQQQMGFRLLKNENIRLTINDQSIQLIGLENWGAGRFSKYGDLQKAIAGTNPDEVQILLSHDPSHWDEQVLGKTAIDFALAGHTHGAQLGVEAPGFRFSPSQFLYPRWAGLYQENGQQLYVNRGFGYIGYAGRVGIWPEITLFTLQKA